MAMKQPRFEVYEAKDGWRWRLKARNGRILADSGREPVENQHKAALDALIYNVWDSALRLPPNSEYEFRDGIIAAFESEEDAILFAKAKASRNGGFKSTIWVGLNVWDRYQIPVD